MSGEESNLLNVPSPAVGTPFQGSLQERRWDMFKALEDLKKLPYSDNLKPDYKHENSIAWVLSKNGFLEIQATDTVLEAAKDRKDGKLTKVGQDLYKLSIKAQKTGKPFEPDFFQGKEGAAKRNAELAVMSPIYTPKHRGQKGSTEELDNFLLGTEKYPSIFRTKFEDITEFPCGTFMQQPFGPNSWPDFIIKVHPEFVLFLEAKSTEGSNHPKYNSSQIHRNVLYVFSKRDTPRGVFTDTGSDRETTFYMGNSIVRDPDIPRLEEVFRLELKEFARNHQLSEVLGSNNPYNYNCNNPRPTFETNKSNFDADVLPDAEYIALEYVRSKSSWRRSGTIWGDKKCEALKKSRRQLQVTDISQDDGTLITFDTVAEIVNQGMTDVEEEDELAPVIDELAVAVHDKDDNAVAGVINSIRRKNAHQQEKEAKNTVPSSHKKAFATSIRKVSPYAVPVRNFPRSPMSSERMKAALSYGAPLVVGPRKGLNPFLKPKRRKEMETWRSPPHGIAGNTRSRLASTLANQLSPNSPFRGGHRKRKKRTRRKKKRKKKGKKTKRRR